MNLKIFKMNTPSKSIDQQSKMVHQGPAHDLKQQQSEEQLPALDDEERKAVQVRARERLAARTPGSKQQMCISTNLVASTQSLSHRATTTCTWETGTLQNGRSGFRSRQRPRASTPGL